MMLNEVTIQLDNDHWVRIIFNEDGSPAMGTTYHPDENGKPCFGTFEFGAGEWSLLNKNPLTIVPSIVCDYCDSHAVIRNGIWDEYWKKEPPTEQSSLIGSVMNWLKNHWGNE